jgi:hypothetical protein
VCHACDIELPYFLSAVGIHEGNTEKNIIVDYYFFLQQIASKIIVLLLIPTCIIGL